MSGPVAPLLSVSGLHVRYGAIAAVRGVDLEVGAAEIVGIVGPNGAGKSSLLGSVAGIIAPAAGTVCFAGAELTSLALEDVVGTGVALVPEGRHIFGSLTVAENLALGATSRQDATATRADIMRAYDTFPILGARRSQPAGQLSGGEQQQLAIARALLSRPKLLMLDEPSLGLAPLIVDQVYRIIQTIREDGVAVVLVEQNAERAFTICDRVHVMSGGHFALSGRPADLRGNAGFDGAYFGTSMEAGAA